MLEIESAEALRKLARQYRVDGEHLSAIEASARSMTMSLMSAPLTKARRQLEGGQVEDAKAILEEVLRSDREDVIALRMLGDLHMRLKQPVEAEQAFRQSLVLVPHQIDALHGLAIALYRQKRLREATEVTDRLLYYSPTDVSGRLLKAGLHGAIGNSEMTSALYRGLLSERPSNVAWWLGLGHSERTVGRTTEAIAAYREALTIDPSSGEAWWNLSNLKTLRFTDGEMATMTDLAQRRDVMDFPKGLVHFALGKGRADRGEDREAFRHWTIARHLTRPNNNYDPDAASTRMRHWVHLSLAECSSPSGLTGNRHDSPIFIVGLPRAGSTLVEQMLGSHSEIEATSELPYMSRIAQRFADNPAPLGKADFAELAKEYLEASRIHRRTDKPYFIDKLPGNFANIGLILAIFPEAKIVDIRKDRLAARLSIFRHYFVSGYDFAYDLRHIEDYYRNYVDVMEIFDSARPNAVHHIAYEALIRVTESEVRRLLAYIGVPFESSCLRWFANGQHVHTPSSEQVRQPIFRDGLLDWQRWQVELQKGDR